MTKGMRLQVMLLSLGCVLYASGCGISESIDKAIGSFNNAIATLDKQSSSWQATVKTLEQELIAQGQSTLANEVASLEQRGIAVAGVELRCNADFVGNRMKLHLQQILARLQKQPVSEIPPVICQVDPTIVDLRLPSARRTSVNFYGYDMDAAAPPKTFLIDKAKNEVDVSAYLTMPTHYLMTLNTSPNGVPFTAESQQLVFRWSNDILGTVGIARDATPFRPRIFTTSSGEASWPHAQADVPQGWKLVGGGCEAKFGGSGQLLVASYPDPPDHPFSWHCQAKDHGVPDPGSVFAYAVAIPDNLGVDVAVVRFQSEAPKPHPSALAYVPQGYQLVGGGCRTTWQGPREGNYIFDSHPVSGPQSDGWMCQGKDHANAGDPEDIAAYAIGIRSDVVDVVRIPPIQSARVGHPSVTVAAPSNEIGIVGGGCEVVYGGAGNILYAAFPDGAANVWNCRSKDHMQPDEATVTGYAFGLKYRTP